MNEFGLAKELTFDAAHRLHRLPPDHPCRNLHGHTYRVKVELTNPSLDPGTAMVVDFAEVKAVLNNIVSELDHAIMVAREDVELREVAEKLRSKVAVLPVTQTTAEELARYIYLCLSERLPMVERVYVWETPTNVAWYGDCK